MANGAFLETLGAGLQRTPQAFQSSLQIMAFLEELRAKQAGVAKSEEAQGLFEKLRTEGQAPTSIQDPSFQGGASMETGPAQPLSKGAALDQLDIKGLGTYLPGREGIINSIARDTQKEQFGTEETRRTSEFEIEEARKGEENKLKVAREGRLKSQGDKKIKIAQNRVTAYINSQKNRLKLERKKFVNARSVGEKRLRLQAVQKTLLARRDDENKKTTGVNALIDQDGALVSTQLIRDIDVRLQKISDALLNDMKDIDMSIFDVDETTISGSAPQGTESLEDLKKKLGL